MMKNSFKFVAVLCVLVGFLTFFSACSASKHAYHKDQYITSQVDPYIYSTDFQRVWLEARSILFRNGYKVVPGSDPHAIETDWALLGNNTRRRYLVTGSDYGNGQCVVHFDYYEEVRNPGYSPHISSGRDYNMEYELIKAVELSQWNSIESAAEQYADQQMSSEKSK